MKRANKGHKYLLKFKQQKKTNNRLLNRKLPGISVLEKDNTVECKQTDSEPTIIRAELPLSTDETASYFEISILGVGEEDSINIGLISKDNNNKQYIGKTIHSIGLLKGDLYLSKKKITALKTLDRLKVGDRIGFGINCHTKQFFFVKNGILILQQMDIPLQWTQFYPAAGVNQAHQHIQFHFEQTQFQFPYFKHVQNIQLKIRKQISNEEISQSDMYSLVQEYLTFNGFSNTLQLYNQKQFECSSLPSLTKISGSQIQLKLKGEQNLGKQPDKDKIRNDDEQMNEPLKFRGRIMSQKLPEEEKQALFQNRRKNTFMGGELIEQLIVEEAGRKLSQIQNFSNIMMDESESDWEEIHGQKVQMKKQEEKEMVKCESLTQKFLAQERLVISHLIKEKRIEEAMEIMNQFIPDILSERYHIKMLLMGHIFLRKIKQEGSLPALYYSKQNKNQFEANKAILFPFYSSQQKRLVWSPLKNIFKALAYNVGGKEKVDTYTDMLSNNQFQEFGNYTSGFILKRMGYLSNSRLNYFIQNIKRMQDRIKDYRGMNCGLDCSL